MSTERKNHWEKVYETKSPAEVSWTQAIPQTSLDFINGFGLPKSAHIIDVGGGDSTLADHLLNEGYAHITVLDISAKALDKAKTRLGEKAEQIRWVVSDITSFETPDTYDIWHDRAAFHFLTTPEQIHRYVAIAAAKVTGYLLIGTFSENGPEKCSGLPVRRYSEQELAAVFEKNFDKVQCITEDHTTPFGTKQHFLFCTFRKK
ncbi:class I SAM-dependent methyltransferase [Chitinophaga lutea]|uniref:Class I SAM-dependent methyltransferase n=1 Tax=Chitinophaga lutea TaxID=2488634 RepID=A0A3N4PKP9_9BACT|nr:class I SAM-dependent methyltransferase [Chitinophaga lutea]RPE08118.1 class I SAM-dependent methyltransferase [Chitinophaga lutea]